MAMDAADMAPLEKEQVQGAPEEGAMKAASMFRKKKKKSAPPKAMPMPMKGGY